MTSPAITKSPDNQKTDKKSPTHSAGSAAVAAVTVAAAERAPSRADSQAAPAPQSEPFSWLRIFKLADLMMKQGC